MAYQGDRMCVFLLLPVLREKVGMRVLAVDIRLTDRMNRENPHPALSRSTGRGEKQTPLVTCDFPAWPIHPRVPSA
jgi:hypothetical protein